jgi:hypothetical protein
MEYTLCPGTGSHPGVATKPALPGAPQEWSGECANLLRETMGEADDICEGGAAGVRQQPERRTITPFAIGRKTRYFPIRPSERRSAPSHNF